MCLNDDGYACPICGLWCKKGGDHIHLKVNDECEHDYVLYPLPYVSSDNCSEKMMCRKCLKVDYLNG